MVCPGTTYVHRSKPSYRIVGHKSVVHAEVGTTERDDANHGNPEARVQAKRTRWASSGLLEAVAKASEGALASADIGGEARTSVVERVHDAKGASAGEAARGNVGGELTRKAL